MEKPNFSYINSLSGGDKEFEKQLLDVVKIEFPREKNLYSTMLSEKKLSEAGDVVHKIKHKISILGLEKSYDVANTFEDNLKDGNTALQDEFEGILNMITEFLEEN